MNRETRRYLVVAVIVVATILFYGSAMTSLGQQEIEPLYNKTRATVPDSLPWYPVIVFGDNRPRAIPWVKLPSVFYDTIHEISMIDPFATIGLGDHVGQGSKRQYIEFYRVMNESGLENQMYAMGNHDVSYGGVAWKYWARYMGPYTLVFDDIPGWRIAILDSEGKFEVWSRGIDDAYRGLGNRSLIVAFHRPIKPYVGHNLQDDYRDKASLLLEKINETGQPVLVLQAHWHGWAEYRDGRVTWLIVGSLGAPLYKASACQAPASCVSAYNYLVLILYPNQTYRYIPVKAGKGSGNFTVEHVNETYVVVKNSKVTVYGEPASIPVRIAFNLDSGGKSYRIYYVAMIPGNTTGYIRLVENPSGYMIDSNIPSNDSYAYITEVGSGGGKVVAVEVARGNRIDLSRYTTQTKTTASTTMTETKTTTSEHKATTTSQAGEASRENSIIESGTTTSGATAKAGISLSAPVLAVAAIILLAVALAYLVKR